MIHRFTLSDEESRAEFQLVSKDLLEHNAAQGVNYWAGSPYPTMLIWAGRVYDFLRVMEEIVGFYPARRQSYLVGYRSGSDGATVSETIAKGRTKNAARARHLARGAAILAGAGIGFGVLRLLMPYVGRSIGSAFPPPILVFDWPALAVSLSAIVAASAIGLLAALRALLRSSVTSVLRGEAE